VDEAWISVDVETSGPTPGTASMISIGACLVDQPEVQFEATIAAIPGLGWSEEAERIHGLTQEALARDGTTPEHGMFVADYLWRFAGRNPFGVSGLDLKALYMGRHLDTVRKWGETTSDHILRKYHVTLPHTHAPLDDALEQAQICRLILGENAGV
jgi:ribonuclease T